MSKETTDLGNQGDWRGLLATTGANSVELAHLEPFRVQLAVQAEKALEIGKQQASLRASKQDLSKQLRVVIVEGNRLATLMRSVVKQHYGIRAEKVAEFGVQPFRGRPRKSKKTPAPGTPESPSTPPAPAGTAK